MRDWFLEWSGTVTGATGSMILALDLNYRWSGDLGFISVNELHMNFIAFAAFSAANLFIAIFALRKKHWGLLTQQCFLCHPP